MKPQEKFQLDQKIANKTRAAANHSMPFIRALAIIQKGDVSTAQRKIIFDEAKQYIDDFAEKIILAKIESVE